MQLCVGFVRRCARRDELDAKKRTALAGAIILHALDAAASVVRCACAALAAPPHIALVIGPSGRAGTPILSGFATPRFSFETPAGGGGIGDYSFSSAGGTPMPMFTPSSYTPMKAAADTPSAHTPAQGDYEAEVLRKMRHKAERDRLIQEMEKTETS